ncbi:SAC3/GANP/Nin1/mts3/eIF-3 p25 family-domain-containing protein [Amylocystis lapponica]|nr:SAC3/GANP/Nin1/mts3/eIF-3 p25 family-domain-containing protein [Amylocystis lapponica]
MMETSSHSRGRGLRVQGAAAGGRSHSRNRKWVAGHDGGVSGGHSVEGERGAHRKPRGGRGHHQGSASAFLTVPDAHDMDDPASGTDDEHGGEQVYDDEDVTLDVEPETPEAREKFYQELVKAREVERKRAIAEGKMDDPLVSKRLDEAITMVGTCQDLCPRFERYRRERENNLDKWEVIPGTKRVDHKRAVKIYERAAGDKSIPSDIRPPLVLRKTLDYLFHDLLMRGNFTQTHDFIRDRSRAVRNDFTLQHNKGPLAIECHDRCARYHILALHFERDNPRFSIALEEQQLMNTLQSLKEFYEDQRGKYQAPTELEMRVYHRLIHIRDQRERHEEIPEEVTSHPVFQLTTKFRLHVQAKSAPISKTSPLIVDAEGMQIFGQLAAVLREQNNVVMIYLVACILERLFGKDTIEDIETVRGDLSIPDIIDGRSGPAPQEGAVSVEELTPVSDEADEEVGNAAEVLRPSNVESNTADSAVISIRRSANPFMAPSAFSPNTAPSTSIPSSQPVASAFGSLQSSPNVFGTAATVFGTPSTSRSVFGNGAQTTGPVFGNMTPPSGPVFGNTAQKSVFGVPSIAPAALPSVQPSSLFGGASPQPPPQSTPTFGSPPVFPSSGIFGTTPKPPGTQLTTPFISSSTSQPSLNPTAATFAPTRPASFFTVPAAAAPSSSTPVPKQDATSRTEPAKVFQPPQPVKSIPNFFGFPPASTPPPSIPLPSHSDTPAVGQAAATGAATPHIVERRQTLWDMPSSTSQSPRLKTVTPISVPVTVPLVGPSTPISPSVPPPLDKVAPISLPSTPTVRWFDPSSQSNPAEPSPTKKKPTLNFPSLQMPASMSTTGILSPLHLSPDAKTPPVPNGSYSPQHHVAPSGSLFVAPSIEIEKAAEQVNGHSPSKGKAKETAADLDSKVVAFLLRSSLIKKPFNKWLERTIDRAAWAEACQRGDAYKRKLQQKRLSSSASSDKRGGESSKRRRASGQGSPETSQAKRVKRRTSAPYVRPLTDEDLARRLKENHEEHERRWEKGSFLRTVRKRVRAVGRDKRCPPEWRLWLSLNPENDGTAIWLEHKFDVPASGGWENEALFSIPGSPGEDRADSHGSPGMIIFERTPLEGLDDEIDRKYRILDDCSRLRDVMRSLPDASYMRFIPSLLVISWSEEDTSKGDSTRDFLDMTSKLAKDHIIANVATFAIPANAKDLDTKFEQFLSTISLNLQDRLLMSITWRKLANLFVSCFKPSASDWLYSCWAQETLDWVRYGHVLRAVHAALNELLRELLSLVGAGNSAAEVELPVDLQTPTHLEKDYATGLFVESLALLPVASAEHFLRGRLSSSYALAKADVENATNRFEQTLLRYRDQLLALPAAEAPVDVRQSPKRRATDDGMMLDDSPPSRNKRAKSSSEDADGTSASPPPSTSISVADNAERPLVTVAMLRALTQDVLETYGRK